MEKEDILEKSRQSRKDEGLEYTENRGRRIGFIVFAIFNLIILILSLFFWQPATLYACESLVFAFLCTEGYVKFRFTKKKSYLITAICGGLATIIFFINFIMISSR